MRLPICDYQGLPITQCSEVQARLTEMFYGLFGIGAFGVIRSPVGNYSPRH